RYLCMALLAAADEESYLVRGCAFHHRRNNAGYELFDGRLARFHDCLSRRTVFYSICVRERCPTSRGRSRSPTCSLSALRRRIADDGDLGPPGSAALWRLPRCPPYFAKGCMGGTLHRRYLHLFPYHARRTYA